MYAFLTQDRSETVALAVIRDPSSWLAEYKVCVQFLLSLVNLPISILLNWFEYEYISHQDINHHAVCILSITTCILLLVQVECFADRI